mmetsp:Transcript_20431/g.64281  ORF Transcript_20431/g.64281 Transcript_20431/m.64281 type:complete len:275 (-) Transcript_20431:3-827(-)
MVLPAAVKEAAREGNLAAVQAYLADADRDPDEAAADGTRLLWNACSNTIGWGAPDTDSRLLATTRTVNFLLARGASPDAWSRNPTLLGARTALHAVLYSQLAKKESMLALATCLVDAGADPMLHDGDGGSAFSVLLPMCSRVRGPVAYEIMVLFLRSGASRESLTTYRVRKLLSGLRVRAAEQLAAPNSSVQKCLDLIDAVLAAGGTWRDYCLQPHKRLLRLRSLVARGRARGLGRTRLLSWSVSSSRLCRTAFSGTSSSTGPRRDRRSFRNSN